MESEKNQIPPKNELGDNSSENIRVLLSSLEDITKSRELKLLLEECMEATRLVMNAEASSLMLLDDETGELNISLPTGPVKKEIKGKRIPKDKGVGGWVIENKQPFISNDLENSDIFWGDITEEFKTRNIICVPLINRENKAIGVLQALNKRRREEFNPHDIPVFQALASHITMAIERVRQQEDLYKHLNELERILDDGLGMISSIIGNDISTVKDDFSREVLADTQTRLQLILDVKKLLRKDEVGSDINLKEYLNLLADKIIKSNIDEGIKIYGSEIKTNVEKAIACGFIMNEILAGGYEKVKAADSGKILVELIREEKDRLLIQMDDSGTGVLIETYEEIKNSSEWSNFKILLEKLDGEIRSGEKELSITFNS